jgi:hypothetical protein
VERADQLTGLGVLRAHVRVVLDRARDAEVDHLHAAIRRHEHVARFQVAVDDAFQVAVVNGLAQLHEQLEALAQLCFDLGLRWLNLQFLTPFGRATRWVNPDTREAAEIAMRVIDAWRDRIRFQVINLPFCFMPGYEPH